MGDILSKASLIKDIELVVKDSQPSDTNNEALKEKEKEKTLLDDEFDHTDNKCVYNGRPNATAPAFEKTKFMPDTDPPSTDDDKEEEDATAEPLAYNILTILTIIVLILATAFGIWAVVHPKWIMTNAKANLPNIKIPMTKKSIGNQMSMKLDMALFKACLNLNVTVQALHNNKKESEIVIHVEDCYDKDNLPPGVVLMKMLKMMMDFVFVLVGLMVGAVHAFVALVLLLWKRRHECCCCTHYLTIVLNGIVSAACSLFGVIIANKKLNSEGKFFYDMIDLATKTKGDAAALMASVKAPLLSEFRKNAQKGGAFDVAMASAVLCTLGFVLLVVLAFMKRQNDKKKGKMKSYLV